MFYLASIPKSAFTILLAHAAFGTAFVVAVSNRTVVTAVDRDHMRDHVFTNIDSAVIA